MITAPLRVLRFGAFGRLWPVFGRFRGALAPCMRIGDCMKCDCECHCGGIPARDAMNDRLYWVEVREGMRCTAWRTGRDPDYPWVADLPPIYDSTELDHEQLSDSGVTVIHEIIPED